MIAALHFNENAGRAKAVNKEGNLEYKIVFPKYKKGSTIVRRITINCTYGGYTIVAQYTFCLLFI